MRKFYVYILASKKNGTLYVGVTGSLQNRLNLHQNDLVRGFTSKYRVHDLVYLEEHNDPEKAIEREKNIKKWKRQWKINLIERNNPEWKDLSNDLLL